MLFIIDFVIVVTSALLFTSQVKFSDRCSVLISWYLFTWGIVVLTSEVAGTVGWLSYPVLLVSHVFVFLLALYLWQRSGKPFALSTIVGAPEVRLLPHRRGSTCLWMLGAGVLAVYTFGLIVILIVPPNNFDSMTYHLSRVGYWIQHRSLLPWPTPNPRQVAFPANAEIGIAWTVLFWGTDQLAGLIQWIAVPILMIAIFGIARLMGYSRAQGAFPALLFATLPEVVLQSTSTQNDLVASSFCACAVYLFYYGMKTEERKALWMSGLAIGLAIGTKLTVVLALPGMGIAVALLMVFPWARVSRLLATWAIACVVGFLVFGAYIYTLNLLHYRHPLGPPSLVHLHPSSNMSRVEIFLPNIARYLYQSVDLTGLPAAAAENLHRVKAKVARAVFSFFHIPVTSKETTWSQMGFAYNLRPRPQEDFAWFGPILFLFLIPGMIYQVYKGIRAREPIRLGLSAIALSFAIGHSFLHGWNPWAGRLYLVPVAICTPLSAFLLRPGLGAGIIRLPIIGLALAVMFQTALRNELKPLVGPGAIWNRGKLELRALSHPSIAPLLKAVDKTIPYDARVATILGLDDWDYPLFGSNFTRAIFPIYPHPKKLDLTWFEKQSIRFILLKDELKQRMDQPLPESLHTIKRIKGWSIMYFANEAHDNWDTVQRKLLSSSLILTDTPLSKVDPSLSGRLAMDLEVIPEWGIEGTGDQEFLWLGHGMAQGIRGSLWAAGEEAILLSFDVAPGPGRPDTSRTIVFTLENTAGLQSNQMKFDRSCVLEIKLHLQQGKNSFALEVIDEATIVPLPNGDTRPLLVRLGGVRASLHNDVGSPGTLPLQIAWIPTLVY